MHRVLVLNATYEPLSIVSVKRALVLLLKEKAELIECAEEREVYNSAGGGCFCFLDEY